MTNQKVIMILIILKKFSDFQKKYIKCFLRYNEKKNINNTSS